MDPVAIFVLRVPLVMASNACVRMLLARRMVGKFVKVLVKSLFSFLMIRTIVDHVATSVLMASLAKTSHVSVVLVKNLATRHVLILLPPTRMMQTIVDFVATYALRVLLARTRSAVVHLVL